MPSTYTLEGYSVHDVHSVVYLSITVYIHEYEYMVDTNSRYSCTKLIYIYSVFPYSYIETQVWENEKLKWEHEPERRVFPRNFEFSQTSTSVYITYGNTGKMFSISFIK